MKIHESQNARRVARGEAESVQGEGEHSSLRSFPATQKSVSLWCDRISSHACMWLTETETKANAEERL